MTSPTLHVLHIPDRGTADEDNGGELEEYGFRSRRHALKTLLPGILESVPILEFLDLRMMGHQTFWQPLSRAFREACPHLHCIHITESRHVLTKGALSALSRIEQLAELRINIAGRLYHSFEDWNVPSITHTFASLTRLHLTGRTSGVAALVCAIVAPRLNDVELVAGSSMDDTIPNATKVFRAALSTAFGTLCDRNATTVRRLSLTIHGFAPVLPRRPSDPDVTIPTVTRPLLGLRRLEELVMVRSIDKAHTSPASVVAAWPSLRMLALPEFVLTPDALKAVARTCTTLETLSAKCLAPDFLEQLPPPAAVQGDTVPALRVLHLYDVLRQMRTADARKIACFLDSLFPRLEAERCSVLFDATHTHRGLHKGGWRDVVRELRRLQSTCRRDGQVLM